MNLVEDIEEITSDQLTISYVKQLKLTLKLKHEECLSLQKYNTKLLQKITELQENISLIESQRNFEILKSKLALNCYNIQSKPSDILQIISSWIPEDMKATIACCIKGDDSWIIIEEKNECQRIPISSLLDDVVLCCALSDDGISESEVIPESILRSLGWSSRHQSVAITVFSSCVWVIVGIKTQEIRTLIPGLNSLLQISTELIISSVMNHLK